MREPTDKELIEFMRRWPQWVTKPHKDDTQAHSLAMKEIARALDRLVGARPTEIRALKGAK